MPIPCHAVHKIATHLFRRRKRGRLLSRPLRRKSSSDRFADKQVLRPDDGRLGVIEQFNFLLVEQSLRSEELMCAARRVLGATVRSPWFASLISRAARNIHLTTSTWKITAVTGPVRPQRPRYTCLHLKRRSHQGFPDVFIRGISCPLADRLHDRGCIAHHHYRRARRAG